MDRKNKKAQGLSTETLIILLLAAAILIIGFMIIFNVGGLRDKLMGFAGGSSTVDDVKSQCALACSQNREDSYNNELKKVVLADKTRFSATCKMLENGIALGCYAVKDKNFVKIEGIDKKENCKGTYSSADKNCIVNNTIEQLDETACKSLFFLSAQQDPIVTPAPCPNFS